MASNDVSVGYLVGQFAGSLPVSNTALTQRS
jgi:hypothetical protein